MTMLSQVGSWHSTVGARQPWPKTAWSSPACMSYETGKLGTGHYCRKLSVAFGAEGNARISSLVANNAWALYCDKVMRFGRWEQAWLSTIWTWFPPLMGVQRCL
jgi:hypothetical protein